MEKSDRIAIGIHNLTIEMTDIEEEAAEGLGAALEMDIDGECEGKGDGGGDGAIRALGAL